MRMGIGQKWPLETAIVDRDAARHVNFANQSRREFVDKRIRVEVMIGGIEVEVLNVEQDSCARLAADQIKKLGIGKVGVRPVKRIRDVFKQERYWNTRPDRVNFRNDRFCNGFSFR